MKKLRILMIVALSSAALSAFAQQSRFGTGQDSVECIQNLNFYRDYFDQKDYKSAYPYWAKAMKHCPPKASQNLYTCGLSIMKYFIETTKDSAQRRQKVDTLMMLYQRRMDNYPSVNKATSFGNMALDMVNYMAHNEDEIYAAFDKAIKVGRENTEIPVMVRTMHLSIQMFDAGKMPADKVIETYVLLSEVTDIALKKDPNDESMKKAKQDIETLFLSCNAASCSTLEPLFRKRFEQNPGDKDMVASIVRLLNAKECTSSDLYVNVAEAYYQLDPSPSSAHALARMFLSKNETDKSMEYYKQAINDATDNTDKSIWLMELGTVYFQQKNNMTQAISYAKQSLNINPQNGKAYMLMGYSWAAQKCGSNEIEQASVFWVAVDFFNKAKQTDASLSADANKYINTYSQYFPRQGDAVMYDLVDGASYTVTCNGLSERTTVRTRK